MFRAFFTRGGFVGAGNERDYVAWVVDTAGENSR